MLILKPESSLNGFVSAIDWSSQNDNLIAFGSQTGDLGFYDLRYIKDKPLFVVNKQHSRLIRSVKFDEKDTRVATCSEDCTTKVFALNKAWDKSMKKV